MAVGYRGRLVSNKKIPKTYVTSCFSIVIQLELLSSMPASRPFLGMGRRCKPAVRFPSAEFGPAMTSDVAGNPDICVPLPADDRHIASGMARSLMPGKSAKQTKSSAGLNDMPGSRNM